MSVENIKTDKELKGAYLTGERPLFHGKKLHIEQTIFNDGESPLKESRDIVLENSSFQWKYPLWYSKNIEAREIVPGWRWRVLGCGIRIIFGSRIR